jgi:hypothetical protein
LPHDAREQSLQRRQLGAQALRAALEPGQRLQLIEPHFGPRLMAKQSIFPHGILPAGELGDDNRRKWGGFRGARSERRIVNLSPLRARMQIVDFVSVA